MTADDTTGADVENVLPRLLAMQRSGLRTCLATLVHADGSSPRPAGSQMAVAEDGSFFGYLTGGCAESAIAEEAGRAIRYALNSATRFGIGSPYLDIQLPCGAGIDIWFDQGVTVELVEQVLGNLRQRTPVGVETPVDRSDGQAGVVFRAAPGAASFCRWYYPARRLYIIGMGPAVAALAAIALASNYEVRVLSPDPMTLASLESVPCQREPLKDSSQAGALARDPYTALVLLFHEHERETDILASFLESDLFYIGALGSQRTHGIRLDLLASRGFSRDVLAKIHGPVGLDIQARTPEEIALSVLSEMTIEYRTGGHPLMEWGGGALK